MVSIRPDKRNSVYTVATVMGATLARPANSRTEGSRCPGESSPNAMPNSIKPRSCVPKGTGKARSSDPARFASILADGASGC